MEIKRDLYLNKLIRSMHNGMIKVVTGIRRCGKSYLLFNLFSDYLKAQGFAQYCKLDRFEHLKTIVLTCL